MRADTVSLIDKLAREHRLKKKEYLALLENASVEEHVHAATLLIRNAEGFTVRRFS